MKFKSLFVAFCLLLGILCLLTFSSSLQRADSLGSLSFEINPPKSHFLLGEKTEFEFKIVNNTASDVSFLDYLKGAYGHLNVYIAKDGEDFKEYLGAGWGKYDVMSKKIITLRPGESTENVEPVFWNSKPVTSTYINDDVVKRTTERKITSNYAFHQVGDHFVKASYRLYLTDRKDPIVVESLPIKITIKAPNDKDLEVWNQIKENGNVAFFIQEGKINIPSYRTEEREEFVRFLETLSLKYPTSFYTDYFRENLAKLRKSELEEKQP